MTRFYYEKKNLSENIILFYPIPSGDADWVCCETTELDACWVVVVLATTGDSRLSNNCDNHFLVDWSSLRTASYEENQWNYLIKNDGKYIRMYDL